MHKRHLALVPVLGVAVAVLASGVAYADSGPGLEAAANGWSFTVNEKVVSMVTGLLIPIMYAAVLKTAFLSSKAKAFIGIVFGAVAALVLQAVSAGSNGDAYFTMELLYRWLFVQVPMWAAYWGFWAPVNLNGSLAPTKGIGPSSPAV